MKSVIISIAIIFSHLAVYSQQSEQGWTLYKSIEGIEIYTQEVDCYAESIPAQKAILVKVENKTGETYRVEWDLSIWYNYEKVTKNVAVGENHYTTDLKPNQSSEGSCETPYGAFYIFKDFITYVSPTKLTRFELENITITKL